MRAAIEHVDGHAASRDTFAAGLGFRELGYEIIPFQRGAAGRIERDPEIVVVGGIASVQHGLQRLGIELPRLESIPEPLVPFAGRRMWSATMREVREGVGQGAPALFVKPAPHMHKAFPAGVVRSFRDLIPSAAVADEEVVTCSEVVELRSEYRFFVCRGRIVDCRRYRGSYRVAPDFGVADAAIEAFASTAPAAFSLDMGAGVDGRTLLVEVNDGYSLGTYGMEPVPYARFLAARWKELAAA